MRIFFGFFLFKTCAIAHILFHIRSDRGQAYEATPIKQPKASNRANGLADR